LNAALLDTDTPRLRKEIEQRLWASGMKPTAGQLEQLARYLSLLFAWNKHINLTGFRELDGAITRLIVEPLLAARHVCGRRLLDVGSGNGSPAIPLKIVLPHVSLRMVEARARKSAFLREVARTLALPDVRIETQRFEQLPADAERPDVITIRAVRLDDVIWGHLARLLVEDGRVVMFRSGTGGLGQLPAPFRILLDEQLFHPGNRLVILQRSTWNSGLC
jgi:16S rRNA (guanine527-N7)-methyltransferase